jgi:predicted TIM-barrel fold metal-dependent hydrolase
MSRGPVSVVALVVSLTFTAAFPATQEPTAPWREDALFRRLAAELDTVQAIANPTHLRGRSVFNPDIDAFGPLLLRSTNPWLPSILKSRFGVTPSPGDWKQTISQLDKARDAMIARLTADGYWRDHLDYTRTEIALVNTNQQRRTDGVRLRWVPHAGVLLYPLAAEHLMSRSPSHREDIAEAQKDLHRFLDDTGLDTVPAELAGYLKFVDDILVHWHKEGAAAVKFWEAYMRTLRIADVPHSRATLLYARGRKEPLVRDDYIALQDFLWRHILLKAGELSLPVHIHSSLGVPPFLRTLESDVRNLEDVLADPRFFKTPVVLIHGGGPWHDIAAYLALKPNVWIDISSMAFVYPTRELARILRTHLTFAPQKVLFGTDAGGSSGVPGDDVHHILLSRATREALYLALSGLVQDGVVTEAQALEMGRGVLRENARRLYGWK